MSAHTVTITLRTRGRKPSGNELVDCVMKFGAIATGGELEKHKPAGKEWTAGYLARWLRCANGSIDMDLCPNPAAVGRLEKVILAVTRFDRRVRLDDLMGPAGRMAAVLDGRSTIGPAKEWHGMEMCRWHEEGRAVRHSVQIIDSRA